MKYFVLVYDQASGAVVAQEEFPAGASREALERRFEFEREHASEQTVEVVLLSAASFADLTKTHARYFKSVGQLAAAR